MKCPECGAKTRVIYTRGDYALVRRRECRGCGARFTSAERPLPEAPGGKETGKRKVPEAQQV